MPQTLISLRRVGLLICLHFSANAASDLAVRGFAVVPEPQRIELKPGSVFVTRGPEVITGNGVRRSDPAVEILTETFGAPNGTRGTAIRLELAEGSVQAGPSLDKSRKEIQGDAYRLEIAPGQIRVFANAPAGLFYGASVLAQMARRDGERFRVPEGTITDWPDLHRRHIYWDDAHHLERLDELKRAIKTAALFRINGFALKLEGHFQFQSTPAVVEPYAMTPQQYQELTDYALRYHVQLIPYLDGPAHIAFLLKHPSLVGLREFPNNNYELCLTNPDSYKLMLGLIGDLLRANRGGRYFYLSTDEAYYVGKSSSAQCDEAAAAAKLGSRGKLLTEFLQKVGGYLNDQGRTVFFWGEPPLTKADLGSVPGFLVNGEVNSPDIDRQYRELGIRQTIYTAIEGEEQLFPDYYPLPASMRLHTAPGRRPQPPGRVPEAYFKIASDSSRKNSMLIGAVVSGWGDMGLHPETFWLGYAAGTAAAWNPRSDPRELTQAFFDAYYGEHTVRMDRVYQLLSEQAQFWSDSWQNGPSGARKPILGNSESIYTQPRPAHDQFIELPPLPSGDNLGSATDTSATAGRLAELVGIHRSAVNELTGLLYENLQRAERNHYSLEVFLAIAEICRHNLNLLQAFDDVSGDFTGASARTAAGDAPGTLARLDHAINVISGIRDERNRVLASAVKVWQKSWYPRVAEANGRKFVHDLDDVKDHLPDRTVDMTYLLWRELILPVQPWFEKVVSMRNAFATSHGLATRNVSLEWARVD